MRGTPGQGLTSAFSLCVFVLLSGQQAAVTVHELGVRNHPWVHIYVWERYMFLHESTVVKFWVKFIISASAGYWPLVVIFQFSCRLPMRCTASSVCVVNKPIVWITCIILKSRNEPVCSSPLTDRDLLLYTRDPHYYCDLFINCDLIINGFLRQILIKSSATSLDLKQMSISNYGL